MQHLAKFPLNCQVLFLVFLIPSVLITKIFVSKQKLSFFFASSPASFLLGCHPPHQVRVGGSSIGPRTPSPCIAPEGYQGWEAGAQKQEHLNFPPRLISEGRSLTSEGVTYLSPLSPPSLRSVQPCMSTGLPGGHPGSQLKGQLLQEMLPLCLCPAALPLCFCGTRFLASNHSVTAGGPFEPNGKFCPLADLAKYDISVEKALPGDCVPEKTPLSSGGTQSLMGRTGKLGLR